MAEANPISPTTANAVDETFSGLQAGQIFRDCPDCPEMVIIPAGKFMMGSPVSEPDHQEEATQHEVTIGQSFALGRYEITRGEYKRFIELTGRTVQTCQYMDGKKMTGVKGTSFKNPTNFKLVKSGQTDQHPVVCVSHQDAEAYARWLSDKTGKHYRLPTEAEWEYAARAGTQSARYWAGDLTSACDYANVADKAAKKAGLRFEEIFPCTDKYKATSPVGSFRPNNFGLYDILGNVMEWTCSAYTEQGYDGSENTCTNDTTPPRIVRGGSWTHPPASATSAARGWLDTSFLDNAIGFRLAQDN